MENISLLFNNGPAPRTMPCVGNATAHLTRFVTMPQLGLHGGQLNRIVTPAIPTTRIPKKRVHLLRYRGKAE